MKRKNIPQAAKCILFLSIFILTSEVRAQQKVQFTQYMFNELIINPAYAGNDDALSITLVNRNQWVSIEGAPSTQTLTAHSIFNEKRVGLGVSFVNDKVGVHKIQNVQGNFAYRLNISKTQYFSMGLQTGLNIRKSDYTTIVGSNSAVDPLLVNPNFTHTSFTVGIGLHYKSPNFQLGVSAPDIIPETLQISDTTTIKWRSAQYFLYAKYRIVLNANLDIEPSVLVKYLQGLPISYDLNACIVYKKILTIGLSYRKKESIAFLMKAKITPQLQVGYAYDLAIGKVATSSSGSHEILLNYLFKYAKNKIASPR